MTAVMMIMIICLSAIVASMFKRIEDMQKIFESELDLFTSIGTWTTRIEKRMNAVEQIAGNASKKATETAKKVERSVIYDSEH